MIGVPKPVRVRDDSFRVHVRGLPCILAQEVPCTCGPYWNVATKRIVTQVCHVRSRGAGAGDPENIYPGCSAHHMEQHRIGIKTFEARHKEALGGRTLKQIAKETWREYEREQDDCA